MPGQSDFTLHPYALTGLYSVRFSHTVWCPPSTHTPTSPSGILSVLGNLRCARERIHEVRRPVTPGSAWGPEARERHVRPRIPARGVSGEAGLDPCFSAANAAALWTGKGKKGGPAGVREAPRPWLREARARECRCETSPPGGANASSSSSPACLRLRAFLSPPAPRLHFYVSSVLPSAPCPGPG